MTTGYRAIEDDLNLETREMISVPAILATIVLWNLITVWQISTHIKRLVREIKTMSTCLSEVDREQAHQEQTP